MLGPDLQTMDSITTITKNVGFIGAGVMAQAVAKALLNRDLIHPSMLYVSAPSETNFGWWREVKANTTHDNNDIINECPVVILAMKPQYFQQALKSIRMVNHDNQRIFISLLAGLSTSQVKNTLLKSLQFPPGVDIQVFQAIPNTALTVGSGCTAFCSNIGPSFAQAQADDSIKLIQMIFSAGGLCVEVSEELMNPISALSGSGVAYVYLMIEALCDGAVKMGVPRALATKLAAQTFKGAAEMVKITGKHPGQLKDEVCSAGGTTIAAIHALETAGVRGGLIGAIEAAVKRSNELSKDSH